MVELANASTARTWKTKVEKAIAALPKERFASSWHVVSQDDVDKFSHSTHDLDPVHVDPEWSRQNAPYGGTIAPGLWVAGRLLSLLYETQVTRRLEEALGVRYGLNYGYDRLRFVAPVPCGARIRGVFRCLDAELRKEDGARLRLDAVAELEGSDRPAVVADWTLVFLDPQSSLRA